MSFYQCLKPMFRKLIAHPIKRIEKFLYGRIELQPFFESLHRIGLRGMGYMQSQFVDKTGEIGALKYALSKNRKLDDLVVFDVGANHGQFASMALNVLPTSCTIQSFEPSTLAYGSFNKSINDSRVVAHNFGLSYKEHVLKFYNTGDLIGSTYPINDGSELFEKVSFTSLDFFCQKHRIDKIFYLKIDVEGAEIDVLKGALNLINSKKVKYVQFEIGPNNITSKIYFRDFFELLKGYTIYRIVKNGLRIIDQYRDYLEIPLTSNFLAELKEEEKK
jgi:FkbM family methyltransferase